jgi:hypothetical protein
MNPIVKGVLILVVVAAVLGGTVWGVIHYGNTRYAAGQQDQVKADQLDTDKLKQQAAQEMADANAKTAALDAANKILVAHQEASDATNTATVNDLSSQLAAKRLRDPNANSGCRRSGSSQLPGAQAGTATSSADTAQAGGVLSEQLTELLKRLTREADAINDAYISCRATQ